MFPSTHHGSFPCPYSFFRARLDLCKNICALFLRASQHALGDEINLDPSVSTALFDIYSDRLQAVHAKCSYYTSTPTPLSKNLVYLFDTRRSPSINLTSRSWRDKLLDEMSKTTEHQHELAVKALGDVCHDLEIRCEVAERPFLEAQTRSHDLDEKLKRAGMKHAELKSQAEDQTLMMNELKTENDHLVEQIKSAEQRYQTLLDSYGTLQAEIDQSTVKTAEAINIAHESAEQKELAHLAIITGKDEVFEAQSFKLADAEAHVASLSDEAVQMRLKISTNNEEIRCLQESLDEKERGSEKDKRTLASLLIEIEHRINHEANLETENRDMISRVCNEISYYLKVF